MSGILETEPRLKAMLSQLPDCVAHDVYDTTGVCYPRVPKCTCSEHRQGNNRMRELGQTCDSPGRKISGLDDNGLIPGPSVPPPGEHHSPKQKLVWYGLDSQGTLNDQDFNTAAHKDCNTIFSDGKNQPELGEGQLDNDDTEAQGWESPDPPVDVFDLPDKYVAHISLPGVKPSQLTLDYSISRTALVLSVHLPQPKIRRTDSEREKDIVQVLNGRDSERGGCLKTIPLGVSNGMERLDYKNANAILKRGILEVEVPKFEEPPDEGLYFNIPVTEYMKRSCSATSWVEVEEEEDKSESEDISDSVTERGSDGDSEHGSDGDSEFESDDGTEDESDDGTEDESDDDSGSEDDEDTEIEGDNDSESDLMKPE